MVTLAEAIEQASAAAKQPGYQSPIQWQDPLGGNTIYGGNTVSPSARLSTGQGYAPEYSQENIQNLTNQYSQLLEPQAQRSRYALANILGGKGSLSGTPGSNRLQLLEGQIMNQVGQYGQGLQQEALGARQAERVGLETRAYEDPFRKAAILGNYQGSPTMQYQSQMIPWITQGMMGKDVLGNTLSGQIRTEREIDPTWWGAANAGYRSPYEQAQYMANPSQFNQMYGNYYSPNPGAYNPTVSRSYTNPYAQNSVRAF